MNKILICILLSIGASSTTTVFADAQRDGQNNIIVERTISDHPQDVDAYWTAERMQNAVSDDFDEEDSMPSGAKSYSLHSYSPQFNNPTDVTRADVTQYPFTAGGKLLFTKTSGKNASCTAQFVCGSVVSQSKMVVLMTAAHCVAVAGRQPNYNLIFNQQYQNGASTASIHILKTFIWDQWLNTSDRKWDYAFLVTDKPSTNGSCLKLDTSGDYNDIMAIGYPHNYESAQYMQKVQGSKGNVSDNVVTMNNNPMKGGASGGAWLKQVGEGGYYAVGLNSYGPKGSDFTKGPVFDDNVEKLWTRADRWKSGIAAVLDEVDMLLLSN